MTADKLICGLEGALKHLLTHGRILDHPACRQESIHVSFDFLPHAQLQPNVLRFPAFDEGQREGRMKAQRERHIEV